MYNIYAIFIGVLITIMVTFNGVLDSYLTGYLSILVIHIVGLIAIAFIFLFKKEKIQFKEKLPIYLFSSGAIGVVMTFLNNICFAYLGASLTLALGVLGQLIVASVIDHFGLLGMKAYKFNNKKIIGFIIIIVGITIMTIY